MPSTIWVLILAGRLLMAVVHIVSRRTVMISARYWSNDGIVAGIFVRNLRFTVTIGFVFILIDHFADRGHRGNRRFGEQTFGFFEFAISLIRFGVCTLRWGQISIPATYYISIQLRVFQIGALECIDLSFQIGQRFLWTQTSKSCQWKSEATEMAIITEISALRFTKSASSVRVSMLAVDLAAFVVFVFRCFTADAFSLLDLCNGELIIRPLPMNTLLATRIGFVF